MELIKASSKLPHEDFIFIINCDNSTLPLNSSLHLLWHCLIRHRDNSIFSHHQAFAWHQASLASPFCGIGTITLLLALEENLSCLSNKPLLGIERPWHCLA